MEWQPIETAPHDRKAEILVCGGTYIDDNDWLGQKHQFTGVTIVMFYDGYAVDEGYPWRGDALLSDDEYRFHCPTHWMPLPEPLASSPDVG